jgi:hypothetical protein
MNIGAIPKYSFPSVGYAMSAVKDGRVSLPVSPSVYIYSHFKHVSGTLAPEGTQGVNISRLKILDTLIEQLSSMKKHSIKNIDISDESDEKRINALIDQYQKQIKSLQAQALYTPIAPSTGALFNLVV